MGDENLALINADRELWSRANDAGFGTPAELIAEGNPLTLEDLNRLLTAARGESDAALRERLADNEKLEWFVYEIFYANPIAFARKNLVIALQRHLGGLPLTTPAEERRAYLDSLSDDERAEWWRAENARRLAIRGVVSE